MGLFSFLFKKPKNPHCECEIDCGTRIEYNGRSIRMHHCHTVLERLMKPFREYPWNQVGVNGQVLETDEGMSVWKLKSADGTVIDSGVIVQGE